MDIQLTGIGMFSTLVQVGSLNTKFQELYNQLRQKFKTEHFEILYKKNDGFLNQVDLNKPISSYLNPIETICFFIKKLIYAVVFLNNQVILEDRFDGEKTIEDVKFNIYQIVNLVKKDWPDLVQYQLIVGDNKNIKILLNEYSGSNTELGEINSIDQLFYLHLECPNISQAQIQNKLQK